MLHARTNCAHCTHALCTLHALIVHAARTLAHTGRSLSLLLRELHISYPVWGTANLLGVSDFVCLLTRWFQGKTVLAERDIDNAYWELPKEGVYNSVKQASQLVRAHRGMRGNFFFSIAKGGERSLHRIGKAADRGFRSVLLEDVLKFVRWDLDHNTLFEMDGWVLN